MQALVAIKDIYLTEVKLTRDLVRGCGEDDRKSELCRLVIVLIRSLGGTPVAVGLESDADTTRICQLGCGIGQGTFLGPPMPLQRLIELIKQRAKPVRRLEALDRPTRASGP